MRGMHWVLLLLLLSPATAAFSVVLNETINETTIFNGTKALEESQGVPEAVGEISFYNNYTTSRLADITVNFSDPYSVVTTIDSCDTGITSNGKTGVHIPQLEIGETKKCFYTTTLTASYEPLNITTWYSTYKPLVNENVTVYVNLTNNNNSRYTLSSVNCSFRTVDTSSFNYTYVISGHKAKIVDGGLGLYWDAEDLLSNATPISIVYNVTMPNATMVAVTDTEEMGNWTCSFRLNQTTLSNFTVSNVDAKTGEAFFKVIKRQHSNGGAWYGTMHVNNTNAVSMNLTEAAVWATIQGSNTPDSTMVTGSYNDSFWDLPITLAQNINWTSPENYFAYHAIPIIWGNFSWKLSNTEYFDDRFENQNGSMYLFQQQVVVINGYRLEITKTVKNMTITDKYVVNITLENTGSGATPDNVYAYDFVPEGFMNYTSGVESPGNLSVTRTVMLKNDENDIYGRYTSNHTTNYGGGGRGWVWQFYPINQSAVPGDNNVTIGYYMRGKSDYELGKSFVIGVDPIQTIGGVASPGHSIVEVAALGSSELMMALVALMILVGAVAMRMRVRY